MAVTVAGTLLVSFAAFLAPASYTAVAQVVLSTTESGNAPADRSAVPPDDSSVDTQIAMLTSDVQLCRLLNALPTRPEFRSPANKESANILRLVRSIHAKIAAAMSFLATLFPRNAVVAVDQCGWPTAGSGPHLSEVKAGLKVFQQRHSLVITVTYTGKEPAQAAAIVNEIVQKHVQQQLQQIRERGAQVVEWLDKQLAAATAERDGAEDAVLQYRLVNGTDPTSKDDLRPLIEAKRTLALAQSKYEIREALLENLRKLQQGGTVRDAAKALGVPVGASSVQAHLGESVQDAIRKLESDAQFSQLQAQAIRADIESMQRAAAAQSGGQKSLELLEARETDLAQLAEDLRHRLNDSIQARGLADSDVKVLTLAHMPLLPSSISPMLLLPPGVFAFLLLGSALAITLDQLDTSFRNEQGVSAELGIPCVGLVPEMSRVPSEFGVDAVFGDMSRSYYQTIRSVLVSVLDLAQLERQPKIVLLTSSLPREGKSMLAVSLGLCAAQLGQRVLLVELGESQIGVAPNTSYAAEWLRPVRANRQTDDSITPVAGLGYDSLSRTEIGGDLLGFLISKGGHQLFHQLRSRYDCIIIDSPAALGSAEVRILASLADEVLLAIRWGKTRREVARHAIGLFRAARTAKDSEHPRLKAVLTRADLPTHARYQYGDAAELLVMLDRRSRSRRRLSSSPVFPTSARSPWHAAARIFAGLSGRRKDQSRRRGRRADGAGKFRTDPAEQR